MLRARGLTKYVTEVDDHTYRVLGDVDMAGLLDRFGDDAHRLTSVQALKPDLETVFLAVTGARIDDDPSSNPTSEEVQ